MRIPSYINESLVELALREDLGRGDFSTESTVPCDALGEGVLMAKEPLVLCGTELAKYIFKKVDCDLIYEAIKKDGDSVQTFEKIGVVKGSLASILTGERLVLNFMQRLSGIATLSASYSKVIPASSRVKVTDTRKTTPGWRTLEKYAVRTGGGTNHRFGLDDGVMIKDNHIESAGSITKAVESARKSIHHLMRIEVETSTLDEVKEAVAAGADVIMLDNMDNSLTAQAIKIIDGKAVVEVSGGITIERIPSLATLDIDVISVGALTHSATACDINLTVKRVN